MASKIRTTLLAAVAIGALLNSGIQFAFARGGGGGSGHVGGGAGHVSGAHVAGARGFSGSHVGTSRVGRAQFGAAHVRGLSGTQRGASRVSHSHLASTNARSLSGVHPSVARGNAARALATGATGALAGKAAWNHWGNPNWSARWNGGWSGWNGGWGGWYGGWGGWVGPVFWPYFFGNLLAFAFWPYPYFDPFWTYGDRFVWDALFWPGPYYGPAYAYGPGYYDVYGGYAYGGRTRTARHVAPEITGSTSNRTDLAQSCGGLAPGVTDLPIDRIEATLRLTDEQLKALNELKAASSQASDLLKTSCSNNVPLTPVDRLDAVENRINGMRQALEVVRTPLDKFYNSLNDEQRQRFAALSPARAEQVSRRGSASGNDLGLASLCSRGAEGFTQLPVQRIEQAIKPTQQQLGAFDKLKVASTEAANQLHASCPTQLPQTALDRFDAVSKRLDAMSEAIKTVRPALGDFYASLSDEQKARFNTLGPPSASRPG
jgi:LTXXQ motif family protein